MHVGKIQQNLLVSIAQQIANQVAQCRAFLAE
jgi:hypothetical protein